MRACSLVLGVLDVPQSALVGGLPLDTAVGGPAKQHARGGRRRRERVVLGDLEAVPFGGEHALTDDRLAFPTRVPCGSWRRGARRCDQAGDEIRTHDIHVGNDRRPFAAGDGNADFLLLRQGCHRCRHLADAERRRGVLDRCVAASIDRALASSAGRPEGEDRRAARLRRRVTGRRPGEGGTADPDRPRRGPRKFPGWIFGGLLRRRTRVLPKAGIGRVP